jgi:hypothetical protein
MNHPRSKPRLTPIPPSFNPQIKAKLEKGFIDSRILSDLRKLGYHGPQATFYRYLVRLRATTSTPDVIQRFETAPARQAQYDWSEYVIPSPFAPVKVYVSCLILGSGHPHPAASGLEWFAPGHYGLLPRACWPYREQTKGKVENPFRYLENQFITGLIRAGFADFVRRLQASEQEANQPRHGTTGQQRRR